jgi:hypothetical protein
MCARAPVEGLCRIRKAAGIRHNRCKRAGKKLPPVQFTVYRLIERTVWQHIVEEERPRHGLGPRVGMARSEGQASMLLQLVVAHGTSITSWHVIHQILYALALELSVVTGTLAA